MKNLLIVLLTAAIVIAGAFLPKYLLEKSGTPELDMNYQQVTVNSESSSDYAWRMEQIAEHYYGDGSSQLSTYYSTLEEENEREELWDQFLRELFQLSEQKVLAPDILPEIKEVPDYSIRLFYIFDSDTVSGFNVAELTAAAGDWQLTATMDVESGKLARIQTLGKQWGSANFLRSPEASSWYDSLRGYADYLGMEQSSIRVPDREGDPAALTVRKYFEEKTLDRLAANITGQGNTWMELRALQETNQASICVYQGGK